MHRDAINARQRIAALSPQPLSLSPKSLTLHQMHRDAINARERIAALTIEARNLRLQVISASSTPWEKTISDRIFELDSKTSKMASKWEECPVGTCTAHPRPTVAVGDRKTQIAASRSACGARTLVKGAIQSAANLQYGTGTKFGEDEGEKMRAAMEMTLPEEKVDGLGAEEGGGLKKIEEAKGGGRRGSSGGQIRGSFLQKGSFLGQKSAFGASSSSGAKAAFRASSSAGTFRRSSIGRKGSTSGQRNNAELGGQAPVIDLDVGTEGADVSEWYVEDLRLQHKDMAVLVRNLQYELSQLNSQAPLDVLLAR
jgi:hypothetical protein